METPAPDTVHTVMTGRVLAVTADTGIDTALRVITQARVHHLPVMDRQTPLYRTAPRDRHPLDTVDLRPGPTDRGQLLQAGPHCLRQ